VSMFSGSDISRMADGCMGTLTFLFVAILLIGVGMGACASKACRDGWRVQSPITRSK